MNQTAEKRLDEAADFVIKGDEFYRKAYEKIVAAQTADPQLSHDEIGAHIGKKVRGKKYSGRWVRHILHNRGAGASDDEVDGGMDWRRGSHATTEEIREGALKLAKTDPGVVVRMMDEMSDEGREMVVQDIVQREDFAKAVKSNPVVRDEMLVNVMGTEAERRDRREESERQAIAKHSVHGWRPVIDGLGEANLGLTHVLDALVKLAINRGVDPEEDPLRLARGRAEMVGRSIYEVEMAWGETPITDKIEELRAGVRS